MGMGMGRGTNPLFAVDLLQDNVVGNLIKVSTLDLGANTHKLPAESVLAGSVNHLGLDLGVVRGPGEEDDLVAGTLGDSVVKVVDGVTAVVAGEVTQEVVVGGRGVRRLFNLDRLEVVRDLVDNVLVVLLQLQFLEGVKALRLDGDSGRHIDL